MTDVSERILAIIPARGGSKGVPGKNIRPLAGKPLLQWTVEQALHARMVDEVLVSTDDTEIARVAWAAGAGVVARPPELSGDLEPSESALSHALDAFRDGRGADPRLVVFLQATSPLRGDTDIDRAIARLEETQADSLLSVCPSHSFLWKEEQGLATPITHDWRKRPRRQDMAAQYRENGSIYVFKPWVLREGGNRLGGRIALFPMAEIAGIDIDSEWDFEAAERAMRAGKERGP